MSKADGVNFGGSRTDSALPRRDKANATAPAGRRLVVYDASVGEACDEARLFSVDPAPLLALVEQTRGAQCTVVRLARTARASFRSVLPNPSVNPARTGASSA